MARKKWRQDDVTIAHKVSRASKRNKTSQNHTSLLQELDCCQFVPKRRFWSAFQFPGTRNKWRYYSAIGWPPWLIACSGSFWIWKTTHAPVLARFFRSRSINTWSRWRSIRIAIGFQTHCGRSETHADLFCSMSSATRGLRCGPSLGRSAATVGKGADIGSRRLKHVLDLLLHHSTCWASVRDPVIEHRDRLGTGGGPDLSFVQCKRKRAGKAKACIETIQSCRLVHGQSNFKTSRQGEGDYGPDMTGREVKLPHSRRHVVNRFNLLVWNSCIYGENGHTHGQMRNNVARSPTGLPPRLGQ